MAEEVGGDATGTIEALRFALEREQGKLRALQDIGQVLGSTLDLNEMTGLVLGRIARIMDAERAILFVVDETSGEPWTRIEQGGQTREIRLPAGCGLPGWVARHGRAVNVKDAYQDVRFDADWDRQAAMRTGSTLCMPLRDHQTRTIGVLQVLNKHGGYFTLDDEGMLSALASQVTIALENGKLYLSVVGKNMELLEIKARLERKIRELDVLFEIAQVSAGATHLDQLLEGVLARAMHAIDAEAGSILLADEDTGDLRFRCAVGGDPEAVRRLRIRGDEGICGWVAREGRPQIVNDARRDARHSTRIADAVGYRPRSVLCVPLLLAGGRGALELLNKAQGRREFDQDDLKLASVIAGHVATAIDLAQARERREREDRLSTIGQLLSSVVHDLRGPMAVISGYAKCLAQEEDPARRVASGEAILRQVEWVDAMTGEILAFARGERKLLPSKVYLRPYFEDLIEEVRVELQGRDVELALDLCDRGVAWFDAHKVRRAVHNLVRNAAQAIGEAHGRIVVGVAREEGGALRVTCSDDGPGIPDAIRGRIFDSFTSHGKPDGTGLGLAIVRKVVADHGGEVRVNSRPGETVFAMTFPQSSDVRADAGVREPRDREAEA
jgi:signal transduction histidine kinase